MCASSNDELEPVDHPLMKFPMYEPLAEDHDPSAGNHTAWLLEIIAQENLGPYDVSPTSPKPNPDIHNWISKLEPPTQEINLPDLSLSPDLYPHPCRVSTSFQRNLIYKSGAPTWGRVLAEMSHLVFQHVKTNQMGTSVPQSVFNRLREIATTRLTRSSYSLESITSSGLGADPNESIQLSWKSQVFCERVRTHLDEVARTARESACQKALFFVCDDLDHSGIVKSDMDDNAKAALLAQMEFTSKYGCKFLHKFTGDGNIVWFGNDDFASILKTSLYDTTCPGWCGALSEMQLPDAENVTVCQLTEVSSYVVASQIAWLVNAARFYLETKLQRPTTSRPSKRRAKGTFHPNVPNPFIEWTESLNGKVIGDINTISDFIAGLFSPKAGSRTSEIDKQEMEETVEKVQRYTKFIARPLDIPHYGSLGSFLYADPPPLTISDQSLMNSAVTF